MFLYQSQHSLALSILRDGGRRMSAFTSFEFDTKQQRVKERDRRERLKRERAAREREAKEEEALQAAIRRRLSEGDLRERVVSRVLELLKTEEVEAQVVAAAENTVAARRSALLDEVATVRAEKIANARRDEESRLSEQQRLKDIVRENERRVSEEAKRRAEEERRRNRERQQELSKLQLERKRTLEVVAAAALPSQPG